MNVNISLSQISGERFMELEKGMINLQIMTNMNVIKATYSNSILDLTFVFSVNYNPSIATFTIKGSAKITGDKDELDDIKKNFDSKKPLPPSILQTISNVGFMECVLMSRSLNIPPPLPLPTVSQPQEKIERSNPSYIA
jgi:hypothetical protein